VRRREFITLLCGAAAWSSIANAQQPQAGPPLIGMLWWGKPSSPTTLNNSQALSEGLQEEGYTEGRNIKTKYRYYENLDGLEKAAAELVALNVNVIVAGGTPAVKAVMHATKNIVIVGTSMADPVADGLIASLARPGGNVTGNTFLGPELEPKRLQLLREIAPQATHIAALQHPGVYSEATMQHMLPSGLFLPVSGVTADQAAKEVIAQDVFLALLERLRAQNRYVSDKPSSNYAPAVFAREDQAKSARLTKTDLERAMRLLFQRNAIENEACGKPSRPSYRIAPKT
jgi:ABC transporter substrate binding protein